MALVESHGLERENETFDSDACVQSTTTSLVYFCSLTKNECKHKKTNQATNKFMEPVHWTALPDALDSNAPRIDIHFLLSGAAQKSRVE